MAWFNKSDEGAIPMADGTVSDRGNHDSPPASRSEPREPRIEPRGPHLEPRAAQQRTAAQRTGEARPVQVRALEKSAPGETAKRTSVLGPSLRFRGELSAQEDLIVQGRVEGSITHTQSLSIGTDGSMKGDIRARVIVVDGSVLGDLYATEAVHLRATAKVKGNVFAPRVAISEGAFFQGLVQMQAAGSAVQEHGTRWREAASSAEPLGELSVDRLLSA